MAIDLNAIRNRLNSLQTKVTKTDNLWKPQPGKQQVRILPYVHKPSNPFIELYFHFGRVNIYIYLFSWDVQKKNSRRKACPF